MNKLALYIHLPFCVRKCLYCDFCSRGGADASLMHAYTEALVREIVQNSDSAREYAVDSVFFGGGTPTLLPNEDVQMILCALRENYSIDAHAEISMEANPATADAEKLAFLSSLGINRLSIGVQSMCDEELASLGRVHFAKDAERIFHDARRAHFENINIDLMYGIPGQTEESFSKTISAVCEMSPEHISAYNLTYEEDTYSAKLLLVENVINSI